MKSHKLLTILPLALLLGLSACTDQGGQEQTTTAPKQAEPPAEAKPAEPKPQETAKDTETITNEACLAAVKKETGESNVVVLMNEFSEANTLVQIGVGPGRAPWKCLVSNDGNVAEISFMGTDGDTVEEPAESEVPAATSSSVSQAAIDACLKAVKAQTNESDLNVMSTEFSEANSLVMIAVGQQRAPWKCLVSNDGQGAEVSFAGDEGKL
jgi:hypothetical protein